MSAAVPSAAATPTTPTTYLAKRARRRATRGVIFRTTRGSRSSSSYASHASDGEESKNRVARSPEEGGLGGHDAGATRARSRATALRNNARAVALFFFA